MIRSFVRLFVAGAVAAALSGCGGNVGFEQKGPPAVPVTAWQMEAGHATYFDEYPATVTALNQVEMRPQVSGYITNIYFADGQHVRKGAKLYAIDQQQYLAAYDQAIANLNVAKSNLAKVQQDVDRYNELEKNDAIARQTLEHAQADLQSASMQVAAVEANVKNVETNLRYSVIYAPFDCTIGFSQVKIGSAVTAGQTLLNTVSSDDPMTVDCAVDEKQISLFTRLLQMNMKDGDSTFTMVLPDLSVYPFTGHLSFLDRAVDPQTGTIRIRVTFPNPYNALKAGLTCNLRVRASSADNSLLLPYKAVVEQMGEYSVFVVEGSKVAQRRINLGRRMGDMVVVKDGLQLGELVVTEGVQKVRDNVAVVVASDKPQAAESPRATR